MCNNNMINGYVLRPKYTVPFQITLDPKDINLTEFPLSDTENVAAQLSEVKGKVGNPSISYGGNINTDSLVSRVVERITRQEPQRDRP